MQSLRSRPSATSATASACQLEELSHKEGTGRAGYVIDNVLLVYTFLKLPETK